MLINLNCLKLTKIFFKFTGFLEMLIKILFLKYYNISYLFMGLNNLKFKYQKLNKFLIISKFKLLSFWHLNFKFYQLHKISWFFIKFIPKWIYGLMYKLNKIILYIKIQDLLKIVYILKTELNYKFNSLMDIWVVDFPEHNKRFEINYMLLSIKLESRIILKIFFGSSLNIDSLNIFYNASIWLEREIWDMFGIFFTNHFDLRRILTDYGFYGYPLRKDFPLSGYIELKYNDIYKYVVVDLIEFSQELRVFNLVQ